jgi:ATP-dependent helicase HrpB
VQETVRPELKIVVMSATLAAQPIAAYLHGCPVVECEGRIFPVAIDYADGRRRRTAAELAASGVEIIRGTSSSFFPACGKSGRRRGCCKMLPSERAWP